MEKGREQEGKGRRGRREGERTSLP